METNLTEVYLDNSATTRCSERAKDLMVKVLMEDYGNPSSLHMKGVEAENYIKEAKKKIAKTLKVDEKEILFTSGGTESNNTALIGSALANKRAGNHIITTSIEHASVSAVTGYLEELGFRVTYLKVDANGIISLEELQEVLGSDRRLTICRELTKRYEEKMQTTFGDSLRYYEENEPRGEYVLVIEGKSFETIAEEEKKSWESMTLEEHMQVYENQGIARKEAMKLVAKDRGISKRDVYQALLE